MATSVAEVAPARSIADELAIDRNRTATRAGNWGWLPTASLAGSGGLVLIAVADALSRSGVLGAEPLFWAGLLALVMPIAVRLAASRASRHERIGLIVMLGLELYLVKVMHSSFSFTLLDEVLHLNNALEILRTGAVFPNNSIFPVSAQYPGLEIVTAALASMTGLSAFGAGLLLVGATRLVSTLALFLFFEQVSGSTRAAGLAALIYSATPNYMFYSVLFSYESLALPLALLVLYAATRREEARGGSLTAFTVIALLGIVGVVVTHHMSSYFLVAFLVLWTLLYSRTHLLAVDIAKVLVSRAPGISPGQKKWRVLTARVAEWWRPLSSMNTFRSPSPAGLALVAVVMCLVWQMLVANLTSKYLSPILGSAVTSVIQVIAGEETARQLFRSSSSYVTPLWERVMGIGAVLLCLAGLPFGLRVVWQRYRNRVLALMLAGAAIAYFGMLGMRFTSAAWETGNRASEFLFVGLAFVLAFTGLELWQPRRARWLGRILFAGCMAVAVMGGLIASWPSWLRLAQPYRVASGGVAIEPQGLTAARWALSVLGPDNKLAADTTNGMLMLTYGRQVVFGEPYTTKDLLLGTGWGNWHRNILREEQIQYVVADRRKRSWDPMTGLYFDRVKGQVFPVTELIDPEAIRKFDALANVSQLFDSGNIMIYDVGAISDDSFDR